MTQDCAPELIVCLVYSSRAPEEQQKIFLLHSFLPRSIIPLRFKSDSSLSHLVRYLTKHSSYHSANPNRHSFTIFYARLRRAYTHASGFAYPSTIFTTILQLSFRHSSSLSLQQRQQCRGSPNHNPPLRTRHFSSPRSSSNISAIAHFSTISIPPFSFTTRYCYHYYTAILSSAILSSAILSSAILSSAILSSAILMSSHIFNANREAEQVKLSQPYHAQSQLG
jgi:hypothetical protein